jgi:predicted ribosomally synthesized peptide with SipW-like signal peptide
MLLMAIGLIAVAAGGSGTFATFNAEVSNNGNTFASGTLLLHETPNGGSACTSETDTANNSFSGCTALFTANLANGQATATIALNNAGTIAANSDVAFKVTSCGVTDNSAVTLSPAVFGTAPTCADMDITIQETGATYVVPGTDIACAYGTTTTPPACDAPSNAATLALPTSFTNLKTTGAVNATLAAGATRYYVITINPNVASGNSLQNRKVSFGLTWRLDQ